MDSIYCVGRLGESRSKNGSKLRHITQRKKTFLSTKKHILVLLLLSAEERKESDRSYKPN